MLALSGLALLYTAAVVPVQIFLWDYDSACNRFPTLFFDIAVDSFFLVRRLSLSLSLSRSLALALALSLALALALSLSLHIHRRRLLLSGAPAEI